MIISLYPNVFLKEYCDFTAHQMYKSKKVLEEQELLLMQ